MSGSGHAEKDIPGYLGLNLLFGEETGGQVPGDEGSDKGIQITLTSPLGVDSAGLGELQKE